MLAIISRFHETVLILDSLFDEKKDYQPIFQKFTVLLQMLGNIENKTVDLTRWNFRVATDSNQQNNFYDCGLFVCFNVLGAITNRVNIITHPLFGRNYFKEILDSPINIPKPPRSNLDFDTKLSAVQVQYNFTTACSFYNKLHDIILNPKIKCCDNGLIFKISKCSLCKQIFHDQCKNTIGYMCKCELAM